MAKLTLADLASLANQASAIATINANSALIETAMENTLSRDGTTPNTMGANLDMNSNRILNLPIPVDPTEPVRYEIIQDLEASVAEVIAEAQLYLDQAEDARDAAQLAEANAEIAEANAETAETNAETAETNAEAAAAAALASENAAAASAADALLNSENPAMGYDFSTATADADPGAGFLRFNNATVASATAVYIDNVDRDGATQTGYIDTWDDSTSTIKGYVTVRSVTSGASAIFRVTGSVVDGTGYRKLTVVNVSEGGTFGNNDVIAVMFSRTGDAGTGTFNGPVSSTANAVVRFDGTGGGTGKDSGVIVDDSNNVTGVVALTASGAVTGGSVSAGSGAIGTSGVGSFGSIELNNADTTLTRSGAGRLAVEGKDALLKGQTDDLSTAGYTSTSVSQGTKSSGTFTPAYASGSVQHATNGGAHTLAPPTGHGTMMLDYTNNGSAGAITTSGWTKVVGSFATTNALKYRCFISTGDAGSLLTIQAMQ